MDLGPYILAQMESMVHPIKQNFKTTQDKENSYVDRKRTTKEYGIVEHVFLRVKLKKSSLIT